MVDRRGSCARKLFLLAIFHVRTLLELLVGSHGVGFESAPFSCFEEDGSSRPSPRLPLPKKPSESSRGAKFRPYHDFLSLYAPADMNLECISTRPNSER